MEEHNGRFSKKIIPFSIGGRLFFYFRALKLKLLKPIINIAILAHVDAGKTTLTEQLLFTAGKINKAGNVDKGTATSDFLAVEQQRGISVMASHVSLDYKDVQINIIDTPGHADFLAEVERSLMAVDAVILVVSAAQGVQAQTRVLWQLLEKLRLPRFVVVNKVDRVGVYIPHVLKEIQRELSVDIQPIQELRHAGSAQAELVTIRDGITYNGLSLSVDLQEILMEKEDQLLEKYLLDKPISPEEYYSVFKDKLQASQVFPVMFTLAKTALGVKELLFQISTILSNSAPIKNTDLSGVVFKISHHSSLGKLVYVRLFSGEISKKQLVYNQRLQKDEKVNQLKAVFSDTLVDMDFARTGEVVAVAGFVEAQIGDILGRCEAIRKPNMDTTPLLKVQVKPQAEKDYVALAKALQELSVEDPLLNFNWRKEEKEFHIKINGWIQIEILEQILKDRYLLNTEFVSPSIIYKETPCKTAIGYDAYTMPKPCWAVVKLEIEPAEIGSGVVFESTVGVNDILLKYQKEVERTVLPALEQGLKSWEVTDLKVRLIGGEDHVVHSRAGDFVIATPMAMMDALVNADTCLLEPLMSFVLQGPEDIIGKVTSDLVQMRAQFEQPEIEEGKMKITGFIPLATSLNYPVKLASRTAGQASIQMQFSRYQKVTNELGEIRKYKGINPLDRAKYILKARKALV